MKFKLGDKVRYKYNNNYIGRVIYLLSTDAYGYAKGNFYQTEGGPYHENDLIFDTLDYMKRKKSIDN